MKLFLACARSFSAPFAAFALLGCVAPHSFAQNLVANGSFEYPQTGGSVTEVPAGSTLLTGWTVSSPVSGGGIDIIRAPYPVLDGNQSIDLTGTPGPGVVSQVITVTPGAEYALSFALSSNGGPYANAVTVFFGGKQVGVFGSPPGGTWQSASIAVSSPTEVTELRFVSNLGGLAGAILDRVALELSCGPADLNCDGEVNSKDLGALLSAWGEPGPTDLDGSGATDSGDLGVLLSAWTG
jgi:hypothetical protein